MNADNSDEEEKFPRPALQAWIKTIAIFVLTYGLWALWTLYPSFGSR